MTFDGRSTADEIETEVLTEGDGDVLETGDTPSPTSGRQRLH